MSSYLKAGKRASTIKHKKYTKAHLKRFYKILHELDLVAKAMIKSGIAITKDNVIEEASKYTDRKIESYEKSILLSKIR